MIDDPDFEKVHTNYFEYTPEEYKRICAWIDGTMKSFDVKADKIEEAKALVMALCKKTEENNGKKTVLGECVIRFINE